ncbi:MAG TPA: T9SS type A sorting domain-containing protein [Flavobacteriaceae bacterium]|nr:T9SS type A sorting domain-containing protein [Flavobacteriaceae bacterium]
MGQLGTGNEIDQNIPAQIIGLTGVVGIVAGNNYSLALKSDGTVWGWGWNLTDGSQNNAPMQISNLHGIIAIEGGGFHSLALKNDGSIWAWGINEFGQLGDGNNTGTNWNLPVKVSNLNNVIDISAGLEHSLAVKSDGTVWSWGRNNHGQLGNGSNTDQNIPIQISGLNGVISVSGGWFHSFALKNDGTAWAWGQNGWGQLGNGTYTDTNHPVKLALCNLGIAENTNQPQILTLYPNPVETIFTIETPGMEKARFIFRDIHGRQIHIPPTGTNNRNEYNAVALQPGVYFVTAKSGTFQETVQILKLE